jgi:hypothetical protein
MIDLNAAIEAITGNAMCACLEQDIIRGVICGYPDCCIVFFAVYWVAPNFIFSSPFEAHRRRQFAAGLFDRIYCPACVTAAEANA